MVFRSWRAKWARALLAVVFSLVFLPNSPRADMRKSRKAEPYLTFGFLPTFSTDVMVKRFEPLTDYLSKKLAVKVRFETAADFATFQSRTVTGRRYDFLYTAPHLYYLAQRQAGYRAVAHVDIGKIYAVIVVRKKSPINSLRGLCGKKLTTPPRLALITALVRRTVAAIGCKKGNEVAILSTPSHNAALLNAYEKTSDAAGMALVTLKLAAPKVRNSMRVIGRVGSPSHLPISIAPWVDRKTAEKFTKIILSLKKTKEGMAVLKKMGWPGFKAATPREYDVMEPYAESINY